MITMDGSAYYYRDIRPDAERFDFELGYGESGNILSEINGAFTDLRGIGGFTLKTQASSRGAVEALNSSIAGITTTRGTIGAALSRLEIAGRALDSRVSEVEAANARIRDADIAQESSELIKLNILQQATTAVLAQANQQSSITLQLLTEA